MTGRIFDHAVAASLTCARPLAIANDVVGWQAGLGGRMRRGRTGGSQAALSILTAEAPPLAHNAVYLLCLCCNCLLSPLQSIPCQFCGRFSTFYPRCVVSAVECAIRRQQSHTKCNPRVTPLITFFGRQTD